MSRRFVTEQGGYADGLTPGDQLPGPPNGPAGGDLAGTYPDPTVQKMTFVGPPPVTLDLATVKTPYGVIGRFGPEMRTILWIRFPLSLPIGIIAPGFPATEIPLNVAVEFPGLQVGNAIILMGADLGQWAGTGNPVPLYAYVSNPQEITFGIVNTGGANTNANNLLCTVAWLDPP